MWTPVYPSDKSNGQRIPLQQICRGYIIATLEFSSCLWSKGIHLSLTIHHTHPQTLTNECCGLILDIIYVLKALTWLICLITTLTSIACLRETQSADPTTREDRLITLFLATPCPVGIWCSLAYVGPWMARSFACLHSSYDTYSLLHPIIIGIQKAWPPMISRWREYKYWRYVGKNCVSFMSCFQLARESRDPFEIRLIHELFQSRIRVNFQILASALSYFPGSFLILSSTSRLLSLFLIVAHACFVLFLAMLPS